MSVITLLQAVTLIMSLTFLSYVTAILIPYLQHKPLATGDPAAYAWHVFVPCRDEAAVIGETLDRLTESFPSCHIWVVDDDSEDETAAIVERHAARDPHVHLVRRVRPNARTGKGDALNSAYHRMNAFLPPETDRSRVVVCVVDADGELDPNAFKIMAGPEVFGDERIGAAQTSVIMRNRDDATPLPGRGRVANAWSRYLVRMQDVEFRTAIAAMQMLRMRTNSVGLGGNGQFTRLSVLDLIGQSYGEPWHGALLEDYELGLHVLLSGYRNMYVHDSWVSQEGLVTLRALARQRTRWSQGNMQCAMYLKQIALSPHFSDAGALEAGYFLMLPFLQVVGVFIWPVVSYVIAERLFAGAPSAGAALASSWWFFVLVTLFGLGPFVLWGPVYRAKCEPAFTRRRAWLWGLGYWLYVYYMYVSVTRGLIRIIRGHSGWDKTRRNAELTGAFQPGLPRQRAEAPGAKNTEDRHV